MAEYWKSNAKYWCQYCRIYVDDNKPSRHIHENGKKHKENVTKFIRDVDKRSEARAEEERETKRQLELIERVDKKKPREDAAPSQWEDVPDETLTIAPTGQTAQGTTPATRRRGKSTYVGGNADDEEESDPEDLYGFKVREKTLVVETPLPPGLGVSAETTTSVTAFKKRKAGGETKKKQRNTRIKQ
ncbi:hypothetical protein IWQ60_009684 [Tieghemiomyces parasiticus]|uniref:Matrin-type domain-containing protein n=1 Tax=Tieghemiomyces parasiticus TaxID=78921 RepID=A0A9W7ZTV3_9FUNG|nr:hypothetical protein IWQ60_009684 [Tieghemiomyces parasiticus]